MIDASSAVVKPPLGSDVDLDHTIFCRFRRLSVSVNTEHESHLIIVPAETFGVQWHWILSALLLSPTLSQYL